MKNQPLFLLLSLIVVLVSVFLLLQCNIKSPEEFFNVNQSEQEFPMEFIGSESCRECHEDFYRLWEPSRHGKAMQPVTQEFILNEIITDNKEIKVNKAYYSAHISDTSLIIQERFGSDSINEYKAVFALGSKNVYYFLARMERGRLQTLPIAFDLRKREWYNNPQSAIRHFADMEDEALDWKHDAYTFNTSCYGCHVSQASNNYDPETDSYQTTWKEPGINCEACHGPASEHVRVTRAAEGGKEPDDLKIISSSNFTPEQNNASCGGCHAKMSPISEGFVPGERFYDHFNLVTLENPDFYPDGRDLGENYTMTTWSMSPCNTEGKLDCMYCHTSSGRYRFKGPNANNACMPCHSDKVSDFEGHSRHVDDPTVITCVSCHMPKTSFARFVRSDHSMRPPMPEASMKFGSPNACNICHTDQSEDWANQDILKHTENPNYQDETIYKAGLIEDARKGNWNRLNEMLNYIKTHREDEVFVNSLIRLTGQIQNRGIKPILLEALNYPSPLVRSSAARALVYHPGIDAKNALIKMLDDPYRLVRIGAIESLSEYPSDRFNEQIKSKMEKAYAEYEASFRNRPDLWNSHYNLGNYYQRRDSNMQAIDSYETAIKINDQALEPYINLSYTYSLIGENDQARKYLEQALQMAPDNPAVNLNYALLMGEEGNMDKAEQAFLKTLETDPGSAVAAYNLSVIYSNERIDQAIKYSQIAMRNAPDNPKYAYTYAYYLYQNRQPYKALEVLNDLREKYPDYADALFFMATIHEEMRNIEKAQEIYKYMINNRSIPEHIRKQALNKSNLLSEQE